MNDDVIVLYEACHNLSEDKKTQHKLQTDYPYYCRKNNLYYRNGVDSKGRAAKIVKVGEFYSWVSTKFPTFNNKIPEEFRRATYEDDSILSLGITISSRYLYTPWNRDELVQLYEQKSQKIWDLEDKIEELVAKLAKSEKELAEARIKAERWDDLNKKKGKRT